MTKTKHVEKPFEEDPPKDKEGDADAPGPGHNSEGADEDLADMIEEFCELQEKEEAIIVAQLKDIRQEKTDLKNKAKNEFATPVKAFNARAQLRLIERQDSPEIVLATNRLFKALPVGHNMDLLALQSEIDRIRADKKAATAAKAAEKEAKKAAKKTQAQNEEAAI